MRHQGPLHLGREGDVNVTHSLRHPTIGSLYVAGDEVVSFNADETLNERIGKRTKSFSDSKTGGLSGVFGR